MTCKPKQFAFRKIKSRPEKKKSRTLWRSNREIKKGPDMRELRKQAFDRSEGYCEAGCNTRIFWDTFDLHHVRHRSLGGSDSLENVEALCRKCHEKCHAKPEWTKKIA